MPMQVAATIAEKRDQDLVIVRDGGEIGRIRGFDPAAEFAPKVQFPGCLNAERTGPKSFRL